MTGPVGVVDVAVEVPLGVVCPVCPVAVATTVVPPEGV